MAETLLKVVQKYQNFVLHVLQSYFDSLTKISGYTLHFEPERRYLSKNFNYHQLYGEKKTGNAAESGVIYLYFLYFVDSFAFSLE